MLHLHSEGGIEMNQITMTASSQTAGAANSHSIAKGLRLMNKFNVSFCLSVNLICMQADL